MAAARRIEQVSGGTLLLNQGTIYASLVRLRNRGWISAEWGTSENNRRAKFYSITRAGRRQLAHQAGMFDPVGRRRRVVIGDGHRLAPCHDAPETRDVGILVRWNRQAQPFTAGAQPGEKPGKKPCFAPANHRDYFDRAISHGKPGIEARACSGDGASMYTRFSPKIEDNVPLGRPAWKKLPETCPPSQLCLK